jgi:hypothetical protein
MGQTGSIGQDQTEDFGGYDKGNGWINGFGNKMSSIIRPSTLRGRIKKSTRDVGGGMTGGLPMLLMPISMLQTPEQLQHDSTVFLGVGAVLVGVVILVVLLVMAYLNYYQYPKNARKALRNAGYSEDDSRLLVRLYEPPLILRTLNLLARIEYLSTKSTSVDPEKREKLKHVQEWVHQFGIEVFLPFASYRLDESSVAVEFIFRDIWTAIKPDPKTADDLLDKPAILKKLNELVNALPPPIEEDARYHIFDEAKDERNKLQTIISAIEEADLRIKSGRTILPKRDGPGGTGTPTKSNPPNPQGNPGGSAPATQKSMLDEAA